MDIPALVRSVGETIGGSASARSVYGEPVVSGQRAIIPVARLRSAFGAGGSSDREGEAGKRGGGGGGGKAWATPCGVVEISPEGTRFIYFHDSARLTLVFAAGFLLGAAWALSRSHKKDAASV